jgi:hypothetical protein
MKRGHRGPIRGSDQVGALRIGDRYRLAALKHGQAPGKVRQAVQADQRRHTAAPVLALDLRSLQGSIELGVVGPVNREFLTEKAARLMFDLGRINERSDAVA